MTRYLSRKFAVAVLALVMNAWALEEHLIGGDDFTKALIAVVAAYMAGNVGQKWTASSSSTTTPTK